MFDSEQQTACGGTVRCKFCGVCKRCDKGRFCVCANDRARSWCDRCQAHACETLSLRVSKQADEIPDGSVSLSPDASCFLFWDVDDGCEYRYGHWAPWAEVDRLHEFLSAGCSIPRGVMVINGDRQDLDYACARIDSLVGFVITFRHSGGAADVLANCFRVHEAEVDTDVHAAFLDLQTRKELEHLSSSALKQLAIVDGVSSDQLKSARRTNCWDRGTKTALIDRLLVARKTTALQVANESLSNAAAAPTLVEKDYTLPRTANVHRFVVVDICDREAAAQIDDEMQQLSRISGEEDSPEAFAAEAARVQLAWAWHFTFASLAKKHHNRSLLISLPVIVLVTGKMLALVVWLMHLGGLCELAQAARIGAIHEAIRQEFTFDWAAVQGLPFVITISAMAGSYMLLRRIKAVVRPELHHSLLHFASLSLESEIYKYRARALEYSHPANNQSWRGLLHQAQGEAQHESPAVRFERRVETLCARLPKGMQMPATPTFAGTPEVSLAAKDRLFPGWTPPPFYTLAELDACARRAEEWALMSQLRRLSTRALLSRLQNEPGEHPGLPPGQELNEKQRLEREVRRAELGVSEISTEVLFRDRRLRIELEKLSVKTLQQRALDRGVAAGLVSNAAIAVCRDRKRAVIDAILEDQSADAEWLRRTAAQVAGRSVQDEELDSCVELIMHHQPAREMAIERDDGISSCVPGNYAHYRTAPLVLALRKRLSAQSRKLKVMRMLITMCTSASVILTYTDQYVSHRG